jgi:voltage-gated potassium channel
MKAKPFKLSKKRIFEIIEIGEGNDWLSITFDYFITVAIISNVLALVLLTFDQCEPIYNILHVVEKCTIAVFIIEYVLRIYTAEYLYTDNSRTPAQLKFIFSGNGVIDLLSILPTVLPFDLPYGFTAFRLLRVFRILKLFQLTKKNDSFITIYTVLVLKKNQICSSVLIIITLIIASSLLMYSAEHDAQPEVFENAMSGVWWSVSTLLTVGYGDIYPITWIGKILAICSAFLGVGLVAIPTGIMSAGFVEIQNKADNRNIDNISNTLEAYLKYSDNKDDDIEKLEKLLEKYKNQS